MNLKNFVFIASLLSSVSLLADSPELMAYKKQALMQLEASEKQGSLSPIQIKMFKANIENMTEEEFKAAKEMQAMMQNEKSKMSPEELIKQKEAAEKAMKETNADLEKMTPEQRKEMDKLINEMGKRTPEERNKAMNEYMKQVKEAQVKKP